MVFELDIYFDGVRRDITDIGYKYLELLSSVYRDAPHFGFKTTKSWFKVEELKQHFEIKPNKDNIIYVSLPYGKDRREESSYVETYVMLSKNRIFTTIDLKRVVSEMFSNKPKDDYNLERVIELIKQSARILNPSQIACGFYLDNPQDNWIEYCRDPFYYCIELDRVGRSGQEQYELSEEDREQIDSLAKIREVINAGEITDLLEGNSGENEVFIVNGGIGIIRETQGHAKEDFVYPRYFIRKELRKRGVKLKEGLAEKYARELGIE